MMRHLSFSGAGDQERGQEFETAHSTFQDKMQGFETLLGNISQRSLRGWVDQFGTTVTSAISSLVGR